MTDQRFTRQPPIRTGASLSAKTLQVAARGNVAVLERLIQEDPGLIAARSLGHGRTLLWEAVRHGRRPAIEFLVDRGADVNAAGRYAHETVVLVTPYCLALRRGDDELAGYLLDKGATVDIYRAAFLGEKAHVEALLEAQPALVHAEDPADSVYHVPPLAYAVAGGHREAVDLLLARGADVLPYSRLLFDFAARSGHGELAEALLAKGADAREAWIGSYVDQDTALVSLMITHGTDVNASAHHGWPAIVYLSRGDKGEHPERIQTLLNLGADIHTRGPRQRTALHCAAKAGFVQVIRVLLAAGADVSARMDDAARRAKRTEAVALLVQHGAVE